MNAGSDRNLQLATIDPDPHVLDQVIIRTDLDIAGLVGKQDLHSARSIDSMKFPTATVRVIRFPLPLIRV